MSEANKRLEFDAKLSLKMMLGNPKKCDIEELTGNDLEVIQMDLMLCVADLHTPEAEAAATESAISSCQPVIPLAGDGSEIDSDESSAKDDNRDDERSRDEHDDGHDNDGKRLSSLVKSSTSGKDNILDKQKGNHSIRRPKIAELS